MQPTTRTTKRARKQTEMAEEEEEEEKEKRAWSDEASLPKKEAKAAKRPERKGREKVLMNEEEEDITGKYNPLAILTTQ